VSSDGEVERINYFLSWGARSGEKTQGKGRHGDKRKKRREKKSRKLMGLHRRILGDRRQVGETTASLNMVQKKSA